MENTALPALFIQRIREQFPDEWEVLVGSLEREANTSIHTHPKKSGALELTGAEVPWFKNGILLSKRPSFTLDPLFHAGLYYPQESSSMFIGYLTEQIFGTKKDITCLDFCGSPGGKSLILSDFIGKQGRLISNEIHKMRNSILRENLTKWGVPNFIVTQSESASFRNLSGYFDFILVDAPCSGEGMFRKDPNARSEWSESNVRNCSLRQKNILSDLVEAIKPGGYLIYSTCTFAEEENEQNCRWLLEQGLTPFFPEVPDEWRLRSVGNPDFCAYQFLPHLVPGEGFFVSVFQKGKPDEHHRRFRPENKAYWRVLNKTELTIANNWLNETESVLTDIKGELHISPFTAEEQQFIARHCFITQPGLPVGKIVRSELIPEHGLAMLSDVSSGILQIPLNKDQALSYLRKDPFVPESIPSGWALVTYRDIPLGWIKGIKSRINNYYPGDWKIRMK